MAVRWLLLIAVAAVLPLSAVSAAETLDYAFFKSSVEPIFLKKREGHTRCYVCHVESDNAFRLERLEPGAAFWTEQQSRRNYQVLSTLVAAGDPSASRLLMQPLAPEGGGNAFHSGGRQFASKDDPDWKTMERWVTGKNND
jgi:hypothetical protein